MLENEPDRVDAGETPDRHEAVDTTPEPVETPEVAPVRRTRRRVVKAAPPEVVSAAAASAATAPAERATSTSAEAGEAGVRPVRRRRKATPVETGATRTDGPETGAATTDRPPAPEAALVAAGGSESAASRRYPDDDPVSSGTGEPDETDEDLAVVAETPADADADADADAVLPAAGLTGAAEAPPQREIMKPVTSQWVSVERISAEPTAVTKRSTPAVVLFMAPSDQAATETQQQPLAAEAAGADSLADEVVVSVRSRRRRRRGSEPVEAPEPVEPERSVSDAEIEDDQETDGQDFDDESEEASSRRRRRRGRRGRGRGKGTGGDDFDDETDEAGSEDSQVVVDEPVEDEPVADDDGEGLTRRRRRRRRKGSADSEPAPEGTNIVVRIREPRVRDEVQSVSGSTRLEAKRQRRRDGREQRRTRPPILSESEFLARREAVDRMMVVRQRNDRTQIAVLEDGVLVEHYVARASAATMVGNVYLGRVQNVLPSMEAAFIDLGRGRNAVLYAGEVNWEATGLEGRTRTIEQALKSGDSVLVQVTKDPIGTKGARLTSHTALSGRHLVFVPNGNASGISRKLSDVERKRLRDVLKNLVPDGAGVIVRTAAEGATEDELARDVKRLQAQWDDIQVKARSVSAPSLLYQEPDLVIRVVRDLFNEDFRELIIQGTDAYETVEGYLSHVSPDLVDRMHRYTGTGDVFAAMRIDEQIIKGLDRRVFLPSGGTLVIDRTEAMTVIDVNTGKYTGAGGNLEETVTRNNLEAAEEIVRQLRLRDIGGIIVIDFIDMVLESNRELVLRRLTECLGRDRTKHQVTEITSLGLVQMTRKRVGQGLLEAFSETCEVCKGRGLIFHAEPIPERRGVGDRVAKVVAASVPVNGSVPTLEAAATDVTGGGDHPENGVTSTGSGGESTRAPRRRGRRGATPVDEAPVAGDQERPGDPERGGVATDADAADADGVPAVDAPGQSAGEGAEVGQEPERSPLDDLLDEALDDDAALAAGRRRVRRGGSRRRTRP